MEDFNLPNIGSLFCYTKNANQVFEMANDQLFLENTLLLLFQNNELKYSLLYLMRKKKLHKGFFIVSVKFIMLSCYKFVFCKVTFSCEKVLETV